MTIIPNTPLFIMDSINDFTTGAFSGVQDDNNLQRFVSISKCANAALQMMNCLPIPFAISSNFLLAQLSIATISFIPEVILNCKKARSRIEFCKGIVLPILNMIKLYSYATIYYEIADINSKKSEFLEIASKYHDSYKDLESKNKKVEKFATNALQKLQIADKNMKEIDRLKIVNDNLKALNDNLKQQLDSLGKMESLTPSFMNSQKYIEDSQETMRKSLLYVNSIIGIKLVSSLWDLFRSRR